MTRRHVRLRLWPSRNFLAELEPDLRESSAIEELAQRSPWLRRLYRDLRTASRVVRRRLPARDWVRLSDTRALIQATEFELAFNLGFEYGIVTGRHEGLRLGGADRVVRRNAKLSAALLSVQGEDASPANQVARLLALAWAIIRGAPEPPRHRASLSGTR